MQLCLVPEAMKNWEKRRECKNGRAQESGLKVRRTWGKGWRRERRRAAGTRSKLKMICCVFSLFFLVRVCACAHINPDISQVVIIFLCGCLRGCERVQPCILH